MAGRCLIEGVVGCLYERGVLALLHRKCERKCHLCACEMISCAMCFWNIAVGDSAFSVNDYSTFLLRLTEATKLRAPWLRDRTDRKRDPNYSRS